MHTYKESQLISAEISGASCVLSAITVCVSVNSFTLSYIFPSISFSC